MVKSKTQKKLRIAFFVTSEFSFPIPTEHKKPYAPLTVALELAEKLHAKGHEIVFFGPKGSHSKTFSYFESNLTPLSQEEKLKHITLHDEGKEKILTLADQYIVGSIFAEHRKKPFDIIHIHCHANRVFPLAMHNQDVQIVYTLHTVTLPWQEAMFDTFKTRNQHVVSISNAQRLLAPKIPYSETIYHGVDIKLFPFSEKEGEYLLYVGRIHEAKGVAEAVKVAFQTKEKLLIIGSPISNMEWWNREIKPFLNEHIIYKGFIPREELASYYQKAKALLLPLFVEEPFGMVTIEALSCGTPVIAFNRGSLQEIIEDGKHGFIVQTLGEMVQALKNIHLVDRKNCRKHIEEKFTLDHNSDAYEKFFYNIIKKNT